MDYGIIVRQVKQTLEILPYVKVLILTRFYKLLAMGYGYYHASRCVTFIKRLIDKVQDELPIIS